MVFSSYLFLCAFLPVTLIIYFLTPQRYRSQVILAASWLFYGWAQPAFLGLLIGVTAFTFALSRVMMRAPDARTRFRWLTLGVSVNLACLAYFKYANFAADSLNAVLGSLHSPALPWTHVLLPIGLSFYIFHAISFLVDLHRGQAEQPRDFWSFAAFIALFPHLVAGPVLKYHLLADQFQRREHSVDRFAQGAQRFMAGFCKKVLIADMIAPLAAAAYDVPNPAFGDAWIGTLAYSIQLFFDFSGYTDMAIGLAAMMGFTFPENFRDPYLATSITNFWTRWHMSLSSWLREYLYIPLGGNRKGPGRTYVNLFLTMLLGGLWHGAGWGFVLWGAWNGGFLLLERYLNRRLGRPPPPIWYAIPRTMLLVMLGRVFFRSHDFPTAMSVFGGLFGQHAPGLSAAFRLELTTERTVILVLGVVLVYFAPYWRSLEARFGTRRLYQRVSYGLIPAFVFALALLSAQSYSPFLYFQF
ncbi:membrane-bound O-acyltransferase family protein (plasmid) [Deinococcus sp. KNUC1210]|uniref:MBOAT family O-acyltransferase n=1 Tax=Deinococcus sp. KNUC1210 TaxID=2917691 RepID=UPI001EF0CEEF|nr:MBOAT family O-acyltransferase [Deinococcus sp. KNUC1210]ULH17747.1 membrane-bound O-acyltransferase family protein [Deinococcus sp. KNUC1210]